jgi:nogalaviketone/aklaviketone reductase
VSPRRGVVITGGGGGIGGATARAFADGGCDVLVVGRTEATLMETARDHDTIHPMVADIADPDAPERIVAEAVRVLGRIDVLVNNAAAVSLPQDLAKLGRDVVLNDFATNLFAPMFLTSHALDALEATGGTVVNLSTAGVQGARGIPGSSVYSATKVALDMLTRSWALELGPRGIRVIGVAPGVVDTGIHGGFPKSDRDLLFASVMAKVPSGRLATPEEIAWWIVLLCGEEAAYATGMVLPVDGGLSLR